MDTWVWLACIVFAASLLQTSTGYGFSIVGTPFLLLLYPAQSAIQINIILSLCLSAFMMFRVGKEVDKRLLGKLIAGSIAGLAAGLFVYLYADIRFIKLAVGGLILLLTVLLLSQRTMRQTSRRDYAVGGVSGLLTSSIGVPGPPLLLYFASTGMDKAILRSTTLAYYLFVYSVSLVLQIGFGGTSLDAWTDSLVALPPLLAGILFGQLCFRWISPGLFKIITYVILLFTGGYLFVTSL
ncbi:hypothetical protein PAESOLCIP111_00256 [Paenibacillus solanacearum]|uniref:Probable membrane transporter protein n=1 Tax=Paenibacillus solanacearum TaxID=2048548 RepID=A0A916JSF4_9BACL|nr:sulfite exporter TauE/SafE family protein [Paenibacillus solanacearum]CAG7598769.1 hypothetical protein PAESOLCIP111_00256 [Paenibacillus solanacearum]